MLYEFGNVLSFLIETLTIGTLIKHVSHGDQKIGNLS
jgi:hypothetical protein